MHINVWVFFFHSPKHLLKSFNMVQSRHIIFFITLYCQIFIISCFRLFSPIRFIIIIPWIITASIWNQQTYVLHGLDAVKDIFEEMLESGSVDFIGARGYFIDQRPEYVDSWEKRAIESGFKMRNIVDPEVKGHRITTFSFAQTKYTLPTEFSTLSVFWIYGDKVVISNWMETEPILIVINNKNIHQLYRQQFEVLWNLKAITLK